MLFAPLASIFLDKSLSHYFALLSVNVRYVIFAIYISGLLLAVPLLTIASSRVSKKVLVVLLSCMSTFLLCLVVSKSLWFYFFMYEFFFFPSLFIVYSCSPNIRFWVTLVYFTLWTQAGSLLLMFFFVSFYREYGFFTLDASVNSLTLVNSCLVVLGLGVKIPVWPFHFWLTKTHVESPSFFSIYLSGFLVKTALLGFVLIVGLLDPIAVYMAAVLFYVGIIDSTLKFICQVDLKKLVAYTTIQEMNMIALLLFLGKGAFIYSMCAFMVAHTILSTLFFGIVDILYKKYRSRSVFGVCGVMNSNYILGILIVISVVMFNALPFTIKFFIEVRLLTLLLDLNMFMFLSTCFVVNVFGSFFFFKVWSNVIFGSAYHKTYSLSKKEVVFIEIYLCIYVVLTILFVHF